MRYRMIAVFAFAAGLCLPSTVIASDWTHQPAPFAKALAEDLTKSQLDLLDVIFHVTPPGTAENYAVAAHTASEQGAKSGEDDLGVIETGKPLVEIQKDGKRIGVLVPLFDQQHRTIGGIGFVYVYHSGQDKDIFLVRSMRTRDMLSKKIPSKQTLFADTN